MERFPKTKIDVSSLEKQVEKLRARDELVAKLQGGVRPGLPSGWGGCVQPPAGDCGPVTY